MNLQKQIACLQYPEAQRQTNRHAFLALHVEPAEGKPRETGQSEIQDRGISWFSIRHFYTPQGVLYLLQSMKATTVKFMWHFFWSASRGFHIDSAGVHCAKIEMARIALKTIMDVMQNQRNQRCLLYTW